MKALDGTTRAPWRKVEEEHPGGTLTLECGHMISLEPGVPIRERYQCLDHAAAVHADWESWNTSKELWTLAYDAARRK